MAYDEKLADRVRNALPKSFRVEEKKMMGGLTFMVNSKMCVGVHTDEIMYRIDPDIQEEALRHKGSRIMDFTGKPMKGFVFVKKEAITSAKDFKYWIDLALDFNKKAKTSKKQA